MNADLLVEVIDLTPTSRLVVEQDADTADPRTDPDRQSVASWHPVYVNRDYKAVAPGADTHGNVLARIIAAVEDSGSDLDSALDKHFARAGVPYRVVDLSADRDHLGKYVVYVDPGHTEFAEWFPAVGDDLTQEEVNDAGDRRAGSMTRFLDSAIDEYERYTRGEVYGVTLERLVTWARVPNGGVVAAYGANETRATWEQGDSIWGNYLDGEYTARVVALECLDLTDAERAALTDRLD